MKNFKFIRFFFLSFLKNSFWLTLAEVFFKGLLVILTLLIARYYGPEEYGVFSFLIGLSFIIIILVDLGFNPYLIREVSKDQNLFTLLFSNIGLIKLILTIFTLSIALIVAFFLEQGTFFHIFLFLFLHYILNQFIDFFCSFFRAFDKFKFETLIKFIQGIIIFILSLFFILNSFSLLYISISYFLGTLISFLLSIYLFKKYLKVDTLTVNFQEIKNIISESWPFAISSIAVLLYFKIDTLMLFFMRGEYEVGVYNAFYNLILMFVFFGSIIVRASYPLLSRKSISHRRRFIFVSLCFILIFLSIVIFVFFQFFGKHIIYFVLGVEYIQHLDLFTFFLLLLPIIYLTTFFGPFLETINKQKLALYTALINLGVNIFLNLLLIPHYGMYGAAFATIMTEFSGLLLMSFFIFKNLFYKKKT